MNDIEKRFYDLVVSLIVNTKVKEEVEIDAIVNQFHEMPMFKGILSKESIQKIKAQIKSERSIKLEAGALIEGHKHEKWFLNKKSELSMKYWNRYRSYLRQDKGFPPDVIDTMDDILDTLTDLLGNPDVDEEFQRRGLVLGDVQSGKTANYTGLICKAADAKYKVIVLLTGTIERLRKQTQLRLDEGFIGLSSSAMIKQLDNVDIGVGKFDPSVNAMVLTSTTDDFKAQTARNLNFNLRTINEPVLFVVKKNVSVLKQLNKWLRTFNQNGENKVDTSILVVDDEADNASVNTNPEDRDPTSINNQIRGLLQVFCRASYVGFTATPFANIFIDPETNEQMGKEDLFPKDYIYSLNAPTNYIGPYSIFNKDGSYMYMCKDFTDDEEIELEDSIPLKHKNGHNVKEMPQSLKYAISTFLVANVIRDLRGDKIKHRSMLINVSRFNSVQKQIGLFVNSFLKNMQSAARIYSEMPQGEALQNTYIKQLFDVFKKEYIGAEFSWDEVQKQLYRAIAPVITVIVNQKNGKELNYEDYPDGLRVIAIGGLSLSRGLTLEGLMASYFYRNSRMYDTLMQMGRWFGYRKNYEDLCRIWMTSTSRDWYRHISYATDELKRDIQKYQDSSLTPMDFGLRVRSDLNTLLVTARNKMRTASSAICTISLSEECIETPDVYINKEKIASNYDAVSRFINSIEKYPIKDSGNSKIIKDVNWQHIVDLLDEIDIPLTNETFDTEVLINFVEEYKGAELKNWDIVFANGSSEDETYHIKEDIKVNYKRIAFSLINNNSIARISGSKRRVGTIADGKHGLSEEVSSKVLDKVINDTQNTRKTLRQKDYFTKAYINVDRNPQFIIYNVILEKHAKNTPPEEIEAINKYKGKKVLAFGIGIPKLHDRDTKYAKYKINRIAQALQPEYDLGEEE